MAVKENRCFIDVDLILGTDIEVAPKTIDRPVTVDGTRYPARRYQASSELHPDFEIVVLNPSRNTDEIKELSDVVLTGVEIVNTFSTSVFDKENKRRQAFEVYAKELRVKG